MADDVEFSKTEVAVRVVDGTCVLVGSRAAGRTIELGAGGAIMAMSDQSRGLL